MLDMLEETEGSMGARCRINCTRSKLVYNEVIHRFIFGQSGNTLESGW